MDKSVVRYLFAFTSHFNFLACCREACYGSFVSIIYFVSRWNGFFDAASPSHLRTRKTILFEQLACAAVDPRGT